MTHSLTRDMNVMACRGCCDYPNGKIGIAAIVTAVVSYILAVPASHGCRYFKQPITLSRNFYFGLFSYQDSYGNCIAWSDASDFTTAWSFARAMAILGTVCGTIALAFTLSLSCVSMPNLILKLMSLAYLAAGFCIILTMVVANADCDGCALAGGGILAVVAPILYFCTAAIVFKVPLYNATTTSTKGSKSKDVTVTITELPDGSKKTVKTTIDKKGNKTIEETLELPPSEESEDEEDVDVTYLPDGSIKTTRISYDKDGAKVVYETIERPPQA